MLTSSRFVTFHKAIKSNVFLIIAGNRILFECPVYVLFNFLSDSVCQEFNLVSTLLVNQLLYFTE